MRKNQYLLIPPKNISAAMILIVMLLLFFSKPIINIRTQYHSPANLGQFFPLTHTGYEQTNTSLNDIFLQMHPWAIFNDRSVQQGEVPLWNPYNGLGAPYMANFISAVFSPYNVPFYLFDFRIATILASFLKLFACGFFTFLFLRSFSVTYWPALIGATIFMFSGYNLFFLQWPQSSVSPTVPAALYFVRRLIQDKTVKSVTLWGLMLSLAAGIMAGHPEAFFAVLLMIGVYILHQLYVSHLSWHITKYKTGLLMVVGMLAALFTAIQLLPFFEYAILSNAFAERHGEGGGSFLDASLWPLWVLPDLLGNPSLPLYFFRGHLPGGFTYVEENSLYVSAIGLVLAIVSLKKFRTNSEVRFFALFALIYLIYSYKPINILFIIRLIPGLSYLPLFASSPTYTFALACLAGYGLEALLSNSARRHWRAIGVGSLGIALLGGTLIAAHNLLNIHYSSGEIEARWRDAWNQVGFARQVLFGGLFVTGLILLIGSQLVKTKLPQHLLMTGLLIVTFLSTGFFHRNFFPLSQASNFYPVTPAIQKLQTTVKNDTLAILCKDDKTPGLFPDTNIMYNLRMPSQYEVLYTPFFPKLLDQFFDTAQTKKNMVYAYCLQRYSLKGFQVMSMPYALIHDDFAKDISPSDYESKIEIIPSFSLYKFKNVPNRYYFVNQVEYIDNDDILLKKLTEPTFNPMTKAFISGATPLTLPVTNIANTTGNVSVVQELNNQVTLSVNSQTAGWLIISTSHYPGWRAFVNGQETLVLRANYAFNAIAVNAGQNQVLFKYDPLSVKLGWIISLFGLLGMVGLTIYIRRKQNW